MNKRVVLDEFRAVGDDWTTQSYAEHYMLVLRNHVKPMLLSAAGLKCFHVDQLRSLRGLVGYDNSHDYGSAHSEQIGSSVLRSVGGELWELQHFQSDETMLSSMRRHARDCYEARRARKDATRIDCQNIRERDRVLQGMLLPGDQDSFAIQQLADLLRSEQVSLRGFFLDPKSAWSTVGRWCRLGDVRMVKGGGRYERIPAP